MAPILADRVKESTTTAGLGPITLAGAVAGFRAFSSVCADGDTVAYCIESLSPGSWEVGIGVWNTGGILTRSQVTASSNAGALVNFAAGTKNVMLTVTAATANGLPAVTFPSIANLELRLSARFSRVDTVGGLVTKVYDISGNGRDSNVAAGLQRPRFFSRRFNGGLPCFAFNGLGSGQQSTLSAPIPTLSSSTGFTIVAVAQNYTGGTPSQHICRGQNDGAVVLNNAGNVFSMYDGNIVSAGGPFTQITTAPLWNGDTTHPFVRIDVFNQASSVINCNGTEYSPGNPGNTWGMTSPLYIGSERLGSQAAKMLLYEFLVFSRAINSTERAALVNYYRLAADIVLA